MKAHRAYLTGVVLGLSALFAAALSHASPGGCDYHRVSRVIDGDTFVIDTGERVRLIGVDTPETVDPRTDVEWFGREASAALKGLIGGRRVCLKRDRDGTIDRDRYGRLLRYAYVDDLFVNREMILRGYAFAYTKYPFQYLEEFREAQRYARLNNRGLWNTAERREWTESVRRGALPAESCGEEGTVCAEDARRYIGQRKTVRFFVRKSYDSGRAVFLNSHNDYRDRSNFTAVIFSRYRHRFPEDPARFYWGKTVDVTGEIRLYRGRAEIVVEDPSQIRIVGPSGG